MVIDVHVTILDMLRRLIVDYFSGRLSEIIEHRGYCEGYVASITKQLLLGGQSDVFAVMWSDSCFMLQASCTYTPWGLCTGLLVPIVCLSTSCLRIRCHQPETELVSS